MYPDGQKKYELDENGVKMGKYFLVRENGVRKYVFKGYKNYEIRACGMIPN